MVYERICINPPINLSKEQIKEEYRRLINQASISEEAKEFLRKEMENKPKTAWHYQWNNPMIVMKIIEKKKKKRIDITNDLGNGAYSISSLHY